MPLIDSSLSRYTSPSYSVDFFSTKREGKSISNRIFASHYNKLASSIVATQTRLLPIASNPGTVDTQVNLYFYSVNKVNMTQREMGNAVKAYQTVSNPSGQNGISEGVISPVLFTGSSVKSEFYYGQLPINLRDYNFLRIGFRDNVESIGSLASPCFVGNKPTKNEYPLIDLVTYQDISQAGSASILASNTMAYTPYHSMYLLKGKNVDNTTTYDTTKDRHMIWDSQDVNLDAQYLLEPLKRSRVIIGSSRGTAIGQQYRPNNIVYNAPPSLSGSITAVPAGFASGDKNLLGIGACFINGTFYIPYTNNTKIPASYSVYPGATNSWVRNKFMCYPGFNAPRGHVTFSAAYTGLIAHVLVMGL
jgi:hypothetical protein